MNKVVQTKQSGLGEVIKQEQAMNKAKWWASVGVCLALYSGSTWAADPAPRSAFAYPPGPGQAAQYGYPPSYGGPASTIPSWPYTNGPSMPWGPCNPPQPYQPQPYQPQPPQPTQPQPSQPTQPQPPRQPSTTEPSRPSTTERSREREQPSRPDGQNQPQNQQQGQDQQQQQGQDQGQGQQQGANPEPATSSAPEQAQLASAESANPQSMGDFLGYSYTQRITLPFPQTFVLGSRPIAVAIPVFDRQGNFLGYQNQSYALRGNEKQIQGSISRLVRVFIESQGAFKIADNESPAPQDRIWFNYNFFDNINPARNQIPMPGTIQTTVPTFPGTRQILATLPPGSIILSQGAPTYHASSVGNTGVQIANVNGNMLTLVAPVTAPQINVNQATFGAEKTFETFNTASLGVRLPLTNTFNDADLHESPIDHTQAGDLSVVFKQALWSDCATGDVLSAGVVATLPTGSSINLLDGEHIHSTLIQPFAGFLCNLDSFYVHGFSSWVYPTDERLPQALFNDIGVGWWVFRCMESYEVNGFTDKACPQRIAIGVAPTVELHVNYDLNHRNGAFGEPVGLGDTINLTSGANFIFYGMNLRVGAVAPLAGPKPFDFEIIVQGNLLF
jgi:hypothetical protein